MIDKFKKWLQLSFEAENTEVQVESAVAALLLEVTLADGEACAEEHEHMEQLLARLFGLQQAEVHLWLQQGRQQQQGAVSLYDFTSRLKLLSASQREGILHALWLLAFTDGRLDPLEEAVIRQVAELLYIPHSRFIQLKLQAQRDSL